MPRCPSRSSRNTWDWSPASASIGWWTYICDHREPVKLLLCKAEGTSYEHFVHNMVEVEVEYTLQYLEVLHRQGQ